MKLTAFERSPNGKYIFPVCAISGIKSFANQEYFAKTLAKKFGGSEERMIKEYTSREAKKYLDAGFTKEQIVELVKNNKGKLPKIAPKISKEKLPKKVKKQKLVAVKVEKVVELVNGKEEEVVKKVYPWTNDPNYFGSGQPGIIDYASDDTCHYPNRFLNDMCHGCAIYDKCGFKRKHGPEDYLDPKKTKKQTTVTKAITPFSKEELEAEKAAV
jgi:hypothetical protein